MTLSVNSLFNGNVGGSITVLSRDTSNRIVSYTFNSETYVITYDSLGRIASYTCNGFVKNMTYAPSGNLSIGEVA